MYHELNTIYIQVMCKAEVVYYTSLFRIAIHCMA